MRVIFLQDVPHKGRAGDVKEVADGYARNYLFPKGLAVVATPEEMKRIQRIKKAADERRLKVLEDVKALVQALEETPVTLKAKAGPTGRFFGAITNIHVAQELAKLTGREIDRRSVAMEPIHEPGEYTAAVDLHPEVKATVKVIAQAEE